MKQPRIYCLQLALIALLCSCNAQSDKDMTNKKFTCDIQTGACTTSTETAIEEIDLKQYPKAKLIYYTDPICSACWAIEPELKKLKLEYGHYLDIEYRMGGLLPGWEGFADNANGISKPSDVAHHWDEVGEHTGMSIDGDVWLEDPLDSSFPPSIAFKAAQQQGEDLALKFLRKIREQVFLEKKNITKDIYLVQAIEAVGGDATQFLKDYKEKSTQERFYAEMQEGKAMGVRGFPTFIFVGQDSKGFKISGMSGYSNYVLALEKALGEKPTPKSIELSALELLKKYQFLATKELAFLLSQTEASTRIELEQLTVEGLITKEPQKFGNFWRLVSKS